MNSNEKRFVFGIFTNRLLYITIFVIQIIDDNLLYVDKKHSNC